MLRIVGILLCVVLPVLSSPLAASAEPPPLTLQEAHEMAIHNHPRITLADLKALAAGQVIREARSAYFPQISANAVAVGTADENTRLAAIGALNNPSIFDRNAEGLAISQLITDFGRTANLLGSAKLHAEAELKNAQATRDQVLLAVDDAFFSALKAEAVAQVAHQTVSTRQSFLEQITALAANKLRSDLDVSFAKVNLEDAKLLLSRAQNDLQASFARLSAVLGSQEGKAFRLSQPKFPAEVSTNVSTYVQDALRLRPDVVAARENAEAAGKFAKAERALRYPTLAAVGSAGVVPIHDPELPDQYAAAGLVLNVPLSTGGLYTARQKEAELKAEALSAQEHDLENDVVRDVRIAWLNAQNAFDRWRITGELVDNARQSFSLAQARYSNGLSSIVELNQAELSLVSAEIAHASTQYEYLIQRSALTYQTGAAL
jgi:outer membrane protein